MQARYYQTIILLSCLLFLPHWALAVTVTPLLIDHTAEARDIFEESITIENPGAVPVRVFASVHEITLDEGGSIKTFVPASVSDGSVSVTSWISIDRGRIELPVGKSVTLPISFRLHPQVKPGTYLAFIGFGSGSNRDEAEAATLAGKSPGVIVRILVEDKNVELLRLTRFSADRFITTAGSNHITYSVMNPGDVPLVPEGEVIIYNTRGVEVAALTLNAEKRGVAPGETVTFSEVLPPDGLLGKYKAFMSLEYGNAQRASVHDTAFFYAAPLTYLGGLFVLLMFCTMGLLFALRKKFFGEDDHEDHDGYVAMYVRQDHTSDEADHDINLKQSTTN